MLRVAKKIVVFLYSTASVDGMFLGNNFLDMEHIANTLYAATFEEYPIDRTKVI